nr:unnamed protein product [Naegleria fowleri]
MREIICIQLGQAGIRIGDLFWKRLCREHWKSLFGMNDHTNDDEYSEENLQSFFHHSEKAHHDDETKFIPRTLFVDVEHHSTLYSAKICNRELYDPKCFIFEQDIDSSNGTFSRGFYGEQSSKLFEKRKLVEVCDFLEGFFLFSSCGGGTGSGLCSQLLEHLAVEYPRKIRTCFTLFPMMTSCNGNYSFLSNNQHVVEPYNAMCSMNELTEYADVTMTFDNQALYDICKRSPHRLNDQVPNIVHMNDLIVEVVASCSSSKRFYSGYGADLCDVVRIIPYPRFHFFQSSYCSPDFINHDDNDTRSLQQIQQFFTAKVEMTQQLANAFRMIENVFSNEYLMTKCDHQLGRYMSCSLNFKGSWETKTVQEAIKAVKQSGRPRFFGWMPTGFKCGLYPQHEASDFLETERSILGNPDQSVCAVVNSTSVVDLFKKIERQAKLLFERNSFLHWFAQDGLTEDDFSQRLQKLSSLIGDYNEINNFVEEEPDI